MAGICRAVCIGDTHFDSLNKYNHVFRLIGGKNLSYNDIVAAEIDKAYAYAERQGIEHIWFLGDIAERPRMTQEAHTAWNRCIFAPAKRKFQTRGIIGNHDFEDLTFHSLQAFEAALQSERQNIRFHYGSPVVEQIDGVDVGFLPYPFVEAPRSKKKGDQRPRAYIGHFDVKGAKRDNGRDIDHGADEQLDTGDKWIIGHIHTYQTPRKNVILPGTLHQQNFGETLPKGFLDVSLKYDGDRLVWRYEWIENQPIYTMTNLAIETVSDLDKISADPSNLYKLFIKKGVEIPTTLLRDRPNIVNNLQYRDDGELAVVMQQEINMEVGDDGISFNESQELSKVLASRGLTEAQIRRGLDLLAERGIRLGEA